MAPSLLALLLGVGAAVLVACGGAGTEGGIPPTTADRLKEDFEDVRQAVESGRCEDVGGQLRQLAERVDNLPQSVDNSLQERLSEAVSRLNERAIEDCNAQEEPETTSTQELPEEPVVTETTPTITTEVPEETVPTTPETTPTVPPPDDDDDEEDSGGTPPQVTP